MTSRAHFKSTCDLVCYMMISCYYHLRTDYTQVKSCDFEVDLLAEAEAAAHSVRAWAPLIANAQTDLIPSLSVKAQTMEPKVGTSLNKKGYLYKGPFPSEGFVKVCPVTMP